MPLEIVTIPCLTDNYAFLLHETVSGQTAVVDAPDAKPILSVLAERGWSLDHILITHHHDDHIQGIPDLVAAYGAKVIGHAKDAERLPALDQAVSEGETIRLGAESATILDVSGHTIGHIAFYFPGSKVAFTADSLMALGCGRVFEGTFPMMFESLSKLRSLPDDTVICSGHEYTQANAKFALSVEPDNAALQARAREIDAARASGTPTVPSLLSLEKATNPFLRAGTPELAAAIGMENANPVDIFAEVRTRKDNF